MIEFFKNSAEFDNMVLKPLSHIKSNWELTWNEQKNRFLEEDDSFAKLLNVLIIEIDKTNPPIEYHNNEDVLINIVKTKSNLKIQKNGRLWICGDYAHLLEIGGFYDFNEKNLVEAATGRIKTAINLGQNNFDNLDYGHKKILSFVLCTILYHRVNK